MHVLFARHREECMREKERERENSRVLHIRERVTSCPRAILPLFSSRWSGHPSVHSRSIHPMALLPPFRLLAPTTPGLFLGGSSIAPNHPHLPSCLSVPSKTPNAPGYLPRIRLFPSSPCRPYPPLCRFLFIRGFSARSVHAR